MSKVAVKYDLITWARERSGVGTAALVKKFPKFREWERGEAAAYPASTRIFSQDYFDTARLFFSPGTA